MTYSPHHLVELFTKYPKMLTWGLPSQQLHIFDVRSLTRPNLIWVHFYPVNLKTYLLTVSLPERLDMRVRGQNRSFWACPVHLWCLQNRSGPPMAPNGQLTILSFWGPNFVGTFGGFRESLGGCHIPLEPYGWWLIEYRQKPGPAWVPEALEPEKYYPQIDVFSSPSPRTIHEISENVELGSTIPTTPYIWCS